MRIKEERYKSRIPFKNEYSTRIRFVYSTDLFSDRKSAMRWVVDKSNQLPFARKHIRGEDGNSYHDGTISFCKSHIDNAAEFINDYLNSEINSIMISGEYKGAYITVQIHLNSLRVCIGAEESGISQVEEIEQMLGLV